MEGGGKEREGPIGFLDGNGGGLGLLAELGEYLNLQRGPAQRERGHLGLRVKEVARLSPLLSPSHPSSRSWQALACTECYFPQ